MGTILVKTLSTVVIFFIASSSFADSSSSHERWQGFRRVDSDEVRALNLPFQQFAENAVLQEITVGMTVNPGDKFEVVDIETVPVETDPKILSDRHHPEALQIETCRKQNLRYCPIYGGSNLGTAFFNRGHYYTCRHGFHNWISLASQLNGNIPVENISPPLILRTRRNGQMVDVYNSATAGKPQMQFSAINNNPRLNVQSHDLSHPSERVSLPIEQSDFVEMTLSERLVRDYAVSTRTRGLNNLTNNEETYLIGYPGKTNSFAGGVGDAPGNALMISNGRALGPVRNHALLQTTNYATGGMSGGALVTASGELVGLSCRSVPSTTVGASRAYSYPIDRSLMSQFWNQLTYPSDQDIESANLAQPTQIAN